MSQRKFFCCIGNPPYQEDNDANARKKPVYDSMMDACNNIAHKVELITPARFLFDQGQTPKDWNKKMLNDPHFKVIDFQPDSSKVFRNVEIKGGGVAVTYHDDTRIYEPIGTFIPFPELRSIVSKVLSIHDDDFLNSIVTGAVPYRFTDALRNEHPEYVDELGANFDLRSNVLDKMYGKIFFEDKPNDDDDYVGIFGRCQGQRKTLYIKRKYVDGPENFNAYKVFVAAANGSGTFGEVLSAPLIGEPEIGHTQTFISIGCFDTEDEAQACMKYIKTKFARALLDVLKVTQSNSVTVWKTIPLQDFTSTSDIDWLQAISDIDQQFYKKYELDDNEIAFIEEKVRSMS